MIIQRSKLKSLFIFSYGQLESKDSFEEKSDANKLNIHKAQIGDQVMNLTEGKGV